MREGPELADPLSARDIGQQRTWRSSAKGVDPRAATRQLLLELAWTHGNEATTSTVGPSATGARVQDEMRRVLDRGGQAGPVIVFLFALILGFLLAYAWSLVLVGIILPIFAQWSGRTRTQRMPKA